MFATAYRQIKNKRFRTWLTIGAVAIGVMAVIVITSIGELGQSLVQEEIDNLGLGSINLSVKKLDGKAYLTATDIQTLSEMSEVESAIPILLKYTESRACGLLTNCAVWGIGAGAEQVFQLDILYGRALNSADVASGRRVCLVDASYAMLMYKRENIVGKTIDITLSGTRHSFEVVGVVDSGGGMLQSMLTELIPSFVYLPYTTMQQLQGSAKLDRIAVQLHSDVDAAEAGESIVRQLEKEKGIQNALQSSNVAEQKTQLAGVLSTVALILSAVAAISLVVAGIGIMTVMMVSVNERTREIGIKKAIGAGRLAIMSEFLIESSIITGIGCAMGILAGVLLSWIGCLSAGFTFTPSVNQIAFIAGLTFLVGIVFSVYPALVASKLSPVEALRYE